MSNPAGRRQVLRLRGQRPRRRRPPPPRPPALGALFGAPAAAAPAGAALFGAAAAAAPRPAAAEGLAVQGGQSLGVVSLFGQAAAPAEEAAGALPPEVAVPTGEEDEDILFKRRCKLFRFDAKGSVWRERGVGDAKLLLSRGSGRVRVLMRREETRKVCANHVVAPDTELRPMDGSNKAWTPPLPLVLTGHVSSLPPVLTGHVSSLPPY